MQGHGGGTGPGLAGHRPQGRKQETGCVCAVLVVASRGMETIPGHFPAFWDEMWVGRHHGRDRLPLSS